MSTEEEDEVNIATYQRGKRWFAECKDPGFELCRGGETETAALENLRDGLRLLLSNRVSKEAILRALGAEKAPRHQRRALVAKARRM